MSADQQLLLPLCSPFSPGTLEALGGMDSPSSPQTEMETLRTLVSERLTAAVDDILEVFVKTVVRYREQIDRQRRQLDSLRAAEGRRSRAADIQQLLVSHKEVPPEQQDWSPSLDQYDPSELPHIKEEQEELWTSQEGEQLQGVEEADITKFAFTPVPVKSEEDDEGKPQSSQLHQTEEMKIDSEDCEDSDSGTQVKTAPEPETDDSWDWEDTSESQPGLNPLQKNETPATRGKMFSCSVCGKRFAQKGNVKRHLTLHTGQKQFSCSVCGKTFAHHRTLNRHVVAHSGERPFCCSVCGKTFARKENLKQHLILHTGEKPFGCSVCGKTFAQHGTLSRHVIVHLAEKPFSCSVCGKRFARKENLKRHSAVHAKESPSVTVR